MSLFFPQQTGHLWAFLDCPLLRLLQGNDVTFMMSNPTGGNRTTQLLVQSVHIRAFWLGQIPPWLAMSCHTLEKHDLLSKVQNETGNRRENNYNGRLISYQRKQTIKGNVSWTFSNAPFCSRINVKWYEEIQTIIDRLFGLPVQWAHFFVLFLV